MSADTIEWTVDGTIHRKNLVKYLFILSVVYCMVDVGSGIHKLIDIIRYENIMLFYIGFVCSLLDVNC